MALVLTNIYLEEMQRTTLERLARKNHSNLSLEVRNAIDLYSLGVSQNDLKMLDAASCQAKTDIDAMNTMLDASLQRAKDFFSAIAKIKSCP
jgi:hypothetical protein